MRIVMKERREMVETKEKSPTTPMAIMPFRRSEGKGSIEPAYAEGIVVERETWERRDIRAERGILSWTLRFHTSVPAVGIFEVKTEGVVRSWQFSD